MSELAYYAFQPKHLPQIIIGMGQMIYCFKAPSILIRTTYQKNSESFSSVELLKQASMLIIEG